MDKTFSVLLTAVIISHFAADRSDAEMVTFYTSQASFLAATSSTRLVDFDGVVDKGTNSGATLTRVDGKVTFGASGEVYVASAKAPNSNNYVYESAILATEINSPITSTLPMNGTDYTAIGGDFDSLGPAGILETLMLTLTSGVIFTKTVDTGTLEAAGPLDFFGFTVTGGSIVSITSSQATSYAGLDNFEYGIALTAVPEPSSLTLAGIAALSPFGVFWRRHRRSSPLE